MCNYVLVCELYCPQECAVFQKGPVFVKFFLLQQSQKVRIENPLSWLAKHGIARKNQTGAKHPLIEKLCLNYGYVFFFQNDNHGTIFVIQTRDNELLIYVLT